MNSESQYLQERLDQIADVLREQAETLARNTASLELHMKRSDAMEEVVKDLVKFRYWLLGAAATIGATVPLLLRLFGQE